MFGDFSRFDNNPELGVTGVYLSQGSPILDSDWNEQAIALSNWITLVGRMAAGDTARLIGFQTSINGNVLSVKSGIAMIAGRICQCCHDFQATWNNSKFDNPLAVALDPIAGVPHLVAVDRAIPGAPLPAEWEGLTPSSFRTRTDWRICFAPIGGNPPVETDGGNAADFRELRSRSFGETQHLTPSLVVSWKEHDVRFQARLAGSNLAVMEYHSAAAGPEGRLYKLASTPSNSLHVDSIAIKQADAAKLNGPGIVVKYRPGQCIVLDNLAGRGEAKVFIELDNEEDEFRLAVALLTNGTINPKALLSATVDPAAGTLTIPGQFVLQDGQGLKMQVWNLKIEDDLSVPLIDEDPQESRNNGVRVDVLGDAPLLPGDRWYIPLRNGHPEEVQKEKRFRVIGHRQFRAIARLDTPVKIQGGVLAACENRLSATLLAKAEGSSPTLDSPVLQAVTIDEPPRRFDASFHRLTSALEAARELTRKTACKDLPIRVSYLPLRRWLASVSVHEIADLDLDGFLARIRRSLEVPPEEEHLLTEQASLVLEEASRLAGPLPVETIGSRFA